MNARTGKVAFGPWLGPFETHPSQDVAGVESPIFSDRKGNTYASLGGSRAPPVQTAATAAALGAKGTAASNAATKELYAMMNKVCAGHSQPGGREKRGECVRAVSCQKRKAFRASIRSFTCRSCI